MTTREELAGRIDHTLLRSDATEEDVAALCKEADELGVKAVCVSPSMLHVVRDHLETGVVTCTVVGFPSGAHDPRVKAYEAARACEQGAEELDMVLNLGLVKDGRWVKVETEIREVREAIGGGLLKVILEAAALTDDEIKRACDAAEAAGAHYVKTSTGFHPAGGASEEAVRLMRQSVGERLGVKASGGIRTRSDAERMIRAGASRLGCSASRSILEAE